MSQQNDEAVEQATDIQWQIMCADQRMVERGYPVADIVEADHVEG